MFVARIGWDYYKGLHIGRVAALTALRQTACLSFATPHLTTAANGILGSEK